MSLRFDPSHWALILGGSSGFGLATAQKLARHGMNVAIVHRDRKGAMPAIEQAFDEIRRTDVGFLSFNLDALSLEGRAKVLDGLAARLADRQRVRLLLHSIAFGNLKVLTAPHPSKAQAASRARGALAARLGIEGERLDAALAAAFEAGGADELAPLIGPASYDADALLEEEDFTRTVHSMGTSLATWTQDLFARGLFAGDARVLGLTSEGNEIAWRGYAAVSAAKVALEAVSRSIAVELAPYGVRSNVIQAGVTDSPALRLIPGSERLKAAARLKNPLGRLTSAEDVADFVALLCTDEARWVNGALIRVDGGEHVAG
ncbi:MAG: SDR family oxidoreductase [Deltaproteobacteria bacterium]|nr:SDR family oxidoreductase [Deltaproteobacteria bacterium]